MGIGGKKNKDCIEKQSTLSVMSIQRLEFKEESILVGKVKGPFN